MLLAAVRAIGSVVALLAFVAMPQAGAQYLALNFGMKANDSQSDTAGFYAFLATNPPPGSTLQFAAGDYDFSADPAYPISSSANLTLQHVAQLTISGAGSTSTRFLFHDRSVSALWLDHCTGIKINSLSLEYVDRAFTQGTLTAIDPNGTWIEMAIASGYTSPIGAGADAFLAANASAVAFYDPATRRNRTGTDQGYLVPNPSCFSAGSTNGTVLVKFAWPLSQADLSGILPNDLVTVKAGHFHSIRVERSTGTTFADVRFRRIPSFAVFDDHSTHSTYLGCTIDAQDDELLSSEADGIHVLNQRGPLTISGCSFDRTGDDAIAVHTVPLTVYRIEGDGTHIELSVKWESSIAVGDIFEIFDPANPPYYNTRSTTPPVTAIQGPHYDAGIAQWIYDLTFAAPTVTQVGDLAIDLALDEGGVTIDGNRIRNHRARGMILNVSNVAITNNDISGSTMPGIVLGPEYFWGFSGFARNVQIFGNRISDVLSSPQTPQQEGAISVQVGADPYPPVNSPPVKAIARQNMNIKIHDNVIKQVGGATIVMTNVLNGEVHENELWTSHWSPFGPLSVGNLGMNTVTTSVHLDNCDSVVVHDNRVEETTVPPALPPGPPPPPPPAVYGAYGAFNSSNCSFTNNRSVLHLPFEAQGHPGFPYVGTNYVYNFDSQSWSHTEDGYEIAFVRFGLFGLLPTLPYYLDRQAAVCAFNDGTLDLTVPDMTAVEFDLGADSLASSTNMNWTFAVTLKPVPSAQLIPLAWYVNASPDLNGNAPPPFWSRKHVAIPQSLQGLGYKLRFLRSSNPAYDGMSPFVLFDDLVVWRGMLPDQ